MPTTRWTFAASDATGSSARRRSLYGITWSCGIGVVDVRHLYGVGAVKPEGAIDLVVNLEVWDDQKAYDRLGLISETQDILGVTVPSLTIPVRPGRNLAVILELAAMNNRQKKMGYNAAETLASNVDHAVDNGTF